MIREEIRKRLRWNLYESLKDNIEEDMQETFRYKYYKIMYRKLEQDMIKLDRELFQDV